MEIIPAIMPKSFEDLKEKMSQVSGLVDVIQIDVMDGIFVTNKSWPYIGDDGDFSRIVAQEEDFPFLNTLDFEVDLMVENSEKVLESWVHVGAKRFVLHAKKAEDFGKLLDEMKKYAVAPDNFIMKTEVGIAVDIRTPVEEIYPFVERVDFVQFMGISRIGFQGEPLNDEVLGKIRTLREMHPDMTISVDGGVTMENAEELADAGVNRLVTGSAVYDSENIAESIKELQNI